MKIVKSLVFFIVLFLISFLLGVYSVKDVSETDIYLEGEKYTFRTEDGHRLSAIEKNGTVYLPVISDYLFLDYNVEINDNRIELVKVEYSDVVDLNTKTLKGALFTTENLLDYDLTIFFNWATWCPDCKEFLKNYSEYSELLKEQNIQFVGLPISDKDNVKEDVDNILNKLNVEFINLVITEDMKKQLQSNVANFPSVIIVDSRGKIVYSNEGLNLLFETVFKDIETLDLCNQC